MNNSRYICLHFLVVSACARIESAYGQPADQHPPISKPREFHFAYTRLRSNCKGKLASTPTMPTPKPPINHKVQLSRYLAPLNIT